MSTPTTPSLSSLLGRSLAHEKSGEVRGWGLS